MAGSSSLSTTKLSKSLHGSRRRPGHTSPGKSEANPVPVHRLTAVLSSRDAAWDEFRKAKSNAFGFRCLSQTYQPAVTNHS
jgi:hypothetical protein